MKCEHDKGSLGWAHPNVKRCPYCRITELEAQLDSLISVIEVHVDPTGFDHDSDMELAMELVRKKELVQQGEV